MARKMVDFRTITLVITPETVEQWHQRTLQYLAEGWEVFNTHFIGITTSGSEASFAYDLAKYEEVAEPVVMESAEAPSFAPRKRGRPPKSAVTFEQHPVVVTQYNSE